ncbi:MAG TPA: hypothetical protein VFD82_21270 [Planctomycetota bacterium]|nr:hypothetical protein [Planctomycetota bacterium]
MAHGTQQHGSSGAKGNTHAPIASDPEHDIDARSAAIWFAVGAVAVFFCLWIMVPIFTRVQEAHRVEQKPYGNIQPPIAELDAVKQHEMEFLKGQNPAKMSIEQAMEKMARN